MDSTNMGDGVCQREGVGDIPVSVLGEFDIPGFGEIDIFGTYWKLKVTGIEAIISWCMFHGLISTCYACPICKQPMKLAARKDIGDKYNWSCKTKKKGMEHYNKRSIRIGTWFEGSNLSLFQILLLTCMWNANIKFGLIARQVGVSTGVVTEWANFCREVIFEILERERIKIGGEGTIVEIDESKFGQHKYEKGKWVQGTWVFGGVERGTDKCFFQVVPNRSKEELWRVIKENILPGTVVISDCWKEYGGLENEGFLHLTVNHSVRFRDPDTGVHLNSIDGTWSAIKRSLPGTRQISEDFDYYLAEYIWRRQNKNDCDRMESLFQGIRHIYSPEIEDDVEGRKGKKRKN